MKFFIFIFAVFLSVMFGRSVDAQVSPAPTTAPFNSFEAFWPLVAGRTVDDPLYFLKDLKEKARGWLIFGAAQKADYNTLLGTKRVLETEKLIKEGKEEQALKTLNRASQEFSSAKAKLEEAKSKGASVDKLRPGMQTRLANVSFLLSILVEDQTGEIQTKLEQVIEIVNSPTLF